MLGKKALSLVAKVPLASSTQSVHPFLWTSVFLWVKTGVRLVTYMLWLLQTLDFVRSSSPPLCFHKHEAVAPGQGSHGYIKKISSHEERVCREDLDGETDPRERSELEFRKETACFLAVKELKLSPWRVFQPQT